jgi:Cytochrome c554 and c-prime
MLNAAAPRGSEYLLWLEKDPHARSWATLCSDASTQILERLSILRDGEIRDRAAFDNCLACHNSTRRYDEPRSAEWQPEGIGCAACHGPDQQWGNRHYLVGWQPKHELQNGFVPLKNLVARARVCAACHVGDSDRDMNHDLIAAGHPPLFFEFASYHAQLPKHWRDEIGRSSANFEAQLWLAGQIASLDASLTLLEQRARQTKKPSAWPELSEYTCAACHHDLNAPAGPQTRLPTTHITGGRVHYSPWNRAGLGWLLTMESSTPSSPRHGSLSAEANELQQALLQVQLAMDASFPKGDSVKVIDAAQTARSALDRWITSLPGQSTWNEADASWICRIAAQAQLDGHAASPDEKAPDWESLTQFYLATVSAREGWPGGKTGPLLEPVRSLRKQLTFRADEIASSRLEFGKSLLLIRKIQSELHNASALPWDGQIRASNTAHNAYSPRFGDKGVPEERGPHR